MFSFSWFVNMRRRFLGQKIKLQTVVHIFIKYWLILQIYTPQGDVAT